MHSVANFGNGEGVIRAREQWVGSSHYLQPQTHMLSLPMHLTPAFLSEINGGIKGTWDTQALQYLAAGEVLWFQRLRVPSSATSFHRGYALRSWWSGYRGEAHLLGNCSLQEEVITQGKIKWCSSRGKNKMLQQYLLKSKEKTSSYSPAAASTLAYRCPGRETHYLLWITKGIKLLR